jgi:hypothetical protein
VNAIPIRFYKNIRQDRNRGFLLNHALREIQFPHEIGSANGEFHGRFLLAVLLLEPFILSL